MSRHVIDTGAKPSADDRIEGLLEQVVERREKRLSDEFESKLEALAAPREDRRIPVTAEIENDVDPQAERRPQGEVTTRMATHPLYSRLDDEVRPYRSPESDQRVQEWLQALGSKNVPARLEAQDHIDTLYGRAWEVGLVGDASALATYTGTAGDLVPLPLLNLVMINRDRVAKIPGMSTSIQLTSMGHRVPLMDQATVGMVDEGTSQTAGEPTLSEKLMTSRKMQGHAVISIETLADSAFNTVGLLSQRMGQAMGQLEDEQACDNPAAAGTPPNVTESIREGITPVEPGVALTYALVASTYFAVGQPYRQNAVWLGNAAALQVLTAIADTTGYPIFSTQSARPGAIVDDSSDGVMFRKNVFEVPLLNTQVTTPVGTGCLWFGDLGAYGWGRREGMMARTSDSANWAEDSIAFKFTQRIDAIMLDEGGTGNASAAIIQDIS